MQVGALRPGTQGAVTPVNAERIAKERNVRVHAEQLSLKRDFMSLCRVEALIGEERHFASGTVLGNRHGRMVELDGYVLDAIPEPPVLVTFHRDQPGVVGAIGTLLGRQGINISRMQIAASAREAGRGGALAILNLDRPLSATELRELQALPPIQRACQVL
jgi:D-3-phosphoglycerate dehydrogenase